MNEAEDQDKYFKNQHPWINLSGGDILEATALIATLALGTLNALQHGSIKLSIAERNLFNRGVLEYLRKNGYDSLLIEIISKGESLSDIREVSELRYEAAISKIVKACLKIIGDYSPKKADHTYFSWIDLRD